MQIGSFGCYASARCTLQKALLNQIWFNHIFYGIGRFANRSSHVFQTDRTAAELVQNRLKEFPVHHIQTLTVHIQHTQSRIGNFRINDAVVFHISIIAYSSQKAVGNTRRTAAALGHFHRALVAHIQLQQLG